MISIDVGLLLLRLVVGALFIGHGAQKLFGAFKGPGIEGTAGWFGSIGIKPPRPMAALAGLSELGGGLLLLLGFLNPLGPLGIIATMLVAIGAVHWPKVWVTENGFEYPLVNVTAVVVVALVGPGQYSLDARLGTALPMPVTFLVGLAAVLVATIAILSGRHAAAGKRAEA